MGCPSTGFPCVGPDQWYQPTEEDIYFITGLSRRGEDFPQFPDVPVGVAVESQLMYSQRYIGVDVLSPVDFQVSGGQLQITSFSAEEVRCLSLLVTTIAHFTSDGKCISCTLLYYVDSLVQRPRCIRWSAIFLRQFCIALDRCRAMIHGRENFPFASELFCLFFERFPETRPTFFHHPSRSDDSGVDAHVGRDDAQEGPAKFPTRISTDALGLLASEVDHMFMMVSCPYAGLDWRGCPNILFTPDEPPDARGNISVLFKLI
jgi:hypothetical protein